MYAPCPSPDSRPFVYAVLLNAYQGEMRCRGTHHSWARNPLFWVTWLYGGTVCFCKCKHLSAFDSLILKCYLLKKERNPEKICTSSRVQALWFSDSLFIGWQLCAWGGMLRLSSSACVYQISAQVVYSNIPCIRTREDLSITLVDCTVHSTTWPTVPCRQIVTLEEIDCTEKQIIHELKVVTLNCSVISG